MVLASALMRGIHPPDNCQTGRHPGEGDASHKRTGQKHGVSILMTNHGVTAIMLFLAEWIFCVLLSVA
jgi:hypothetical protein